MYHTHNRTLFIGVGELKAVPGEGPRGNAVLED